jgi:hypothetical protein
MANRSDFYNAKLPRYLKRALSASSKYIGDVHQQAEVRKLFINAHESHVAFKLKRRQDTTDTIEVE